MDRISPHFTRKELECHHCGALPEDYAKVLAGHLEEFRALYGRPVRLSSAYRCPRHPRELDKPQNSTHAHTQHFAVDVVCSGPEAQAVLNCALALGYTGFGISQKGPHPKRFIHIDRRPTRVLWSY